MQRPKDQDEQKNYYSGKKKCHAVKNVLLINKKQEIQYLSPTHFGKVHDKRVADATPYPLPQGSLLLQDLGFLGFTLEGVEIEMPTKKPKGRALTDEQKASNKVKARRRVFIEHVNSSVKRLRILKDVCRLIVSGMRDMVIEIGCAFHNFRLRV
ncbi:MAG: transposase family protein [Nitrososphaerales archaeon]